MTNFLKINQLSQQSGINLETIRYYEKVGLLPPPMRANNGYRLYSQQSLDLLHFIKKCRTLGFSLKEIKQLNQLRTNLTADCENADKLIQTHLKQVQIKLQQLKEIENFLQSIAQCNQHRIEDCKVISGIEQKEFI
ncbi:MerR family transcriptional regulator [Mergibacter septicus]|uniref:MerR family transcriptional regulator n=1 Tax=Mergibacter septicus TaxID=221402 RepID=UPI001C7615E2|nr:MerR family transcriptional regulator [Mergibacter septicus]QDJ13343.1 MerR family transcriptional regulator [Mergibacter septicus]